MLHYWQREIDNLKKLILGLGAIIEEQIQKSIYALEHRDIELAQGVIEKDKEIDSLEITIEEECLKILALYQPVAKELRFVISVLKMNNDLERMGDLTANIASRAIFLSKKEQTDLISDIKVSSEKVQMMVKKSLDALINTDVNIAREVLISDDEVDVLTLNTLKKLIKKIQENPNKTNEYFSIRTISKNLERIADSATNIAEDVVYFCTGEIIRHRGEDFFSYETDNDVTENL